MKKVITFGEIMLRLSAPNYLRLTQCSQLDMSFAGAEANVAVSLSNYGIETDYITCLPNNPIADKCIMELLSYKVGTSHIIRNGDRMGLMYLETGSNARASRVFYDRKDSSIATIPKGSIDWKVIFNGADWFHWSGITPALSENAAYECLTAINVAKELGIVVSCDINYRENLWKYGKLASDVLLEMVDKSNIIIGNEEDFDKVFSIKPIDFDAKNTKGIIEQGRFESVCKQMIASFPNCEKIVITLRGSINANHNTWGGVLYDGTNFFQSKRYDISDIVDRVGSGDSFVGAFIYGLLTYKGYDQKTLDFAVAASCLKHTIKGDYNQMSIDEIENLINGNLSGRVKR